MCVPVCHLSSAVEKWLSGLFVAPEREVKRKKEELEMACIKWPIRLYTNLSVVAGEVVFFSFLYSVSLDVFSLMFQWIHCGQYTMTFIKL